MWGIKTGGAILGVAAATLLTTAPGASAADLGGNCCADLEERIAELEATTARKGNRKVSLEITGFVNEALFFFDDGNESNAYVGTNELEQSRVAFTGKAKITEDLSAGYRLELGINSSASRSWSADNDDGSTGVSVRQSHWYLQSKTLGKIGIGRQNTATYHLLNDTNFTLSRRSGVAEAPIVAFAGFRLLNNGNDLGVSWAGIQPGTQNDTYGTNGQRELVRYDSPEFAGFTFVGTWGEDDAAGAALIYQKTWGDFKVAGRVGYEQNTDENPVNEACSVLGANTGKQTDCWWWGASAVVQHEPTGLFVYGAYGEQTDDGEDDFHGSSVENQDSLWYLQVGLERKYFALGKTNIFADYRHDERGANSEIAGGDAFGAGDIVDGELEFWGLGVVQSIDAASMQLYATYRHGEGDVRFFGNASDTSLDDIDMVITGARIQF